MPVSPQRLLSVDRGALSCGLGVLMAPRRADGNRRDEGGQTWGEHHGEGYPFLLLLTRRLMLPCVHGRLLTASKKAEAAGGGDMLRRKEESWLLSATAGT